MNYEPEFVKLYELALLLWDGGRDTDFARHQVSLVMGKPGTLKYAETTLIGTALVNPSDQDVADVLRDISPSELIYDWHKWIWQACRDVSSDDPQPDRDATLRRVCHQIWVNAKRPTCDFPDAANDAILLSAQFVSAAGIRSIARHFRSARAEDRLRQRIWPIAEDLRRGDISAKTCLDRICALRDEVAVYGI